MTLVGQATHDYDSFPYIVRWTLWPSHDTRKPFPRKLTKDATRAYNRWSVGVKGICSVIKCIACSSREPEFHSQHPYLSSQASVILVPWFPAPCSDLHSTRHVWGTWVYVQVKYPYTKKNIIIKSVSLGKCTDYIFLKKSVMRFYLRFDPSVLPKADNRRCLASVKDLVKWTKIDLCLWLEARWDRRPGLGWFTLDTFSEFQKEWDNDSWTLPSFKWGLQVQMLFWLQELPEQAWESVKECVWVSV